MYWYDKHSTTEEEVIHIHIKYSLIVSTKGVALSLDCPCYVGLNYSDWNLFEKGNHWALSHCPLYPGLTPSGALLTTAYWKFLRTDLHQGSCYEWVGFFCNPSSCDLTSCVSQSLSHVDESLPPTHGFLISRHIKSVFFKHPTTPHSTAYFLIYFLFVETSCAALCSHGS